VAPVFVLSHDQSTWFRLLSQHPTCPQKAEKPSKYMAKAEFPESIQIDP
jgi:hypothetical protein